MGVLIACSSSAHRNLDLLPTRGVPRPHGAPCGTSSYGCACSTYRRRAAVSSGPSARSALGNARRRTAVSIQTRAGCTYAPRPGSVPRGSGAHSPSINTVRSRSCLAARSRQPTQVRSGQARACVRPDTVKSTSPHRPHPFGAGIEWLRASITARSLRRSLTCGRKGVTLPGPSGYSPACSVSGRMSIRQPVRRAARRAFWPSLPIASDSW